MKSEERSVFNESKIASPRIINYNEDNTPGCSPDGRDFSSSDDLDRVLMTTLQSNASRNFLHLDEVLTRSNVLFTNRNHEKFSGVGSYAMHTRMNLKQKNQELISSKSFIDTVMDQINPFITFRSGRKETSPLVTKPMLRMPTQVNQRQDKGLSAFKGQKILASP